MIFKLLPLLMLIGIGIRILSKVMAANALRKKLKAQQEGRLEQYHADREVFWRNVDRISIFAIGIALVWYVIGVAMWLLET